MQKGPKVALLALAFEHRCTFLAFPNVGGMDKHID